MRGASTAPARGGRDRVKRLGAIPGPAAGRFRVWAPARASVAVRIGGETHDLLARRGDASRGRSARRRATTTCSSSTATRRCPTRARASSPRGSAGLRASSRSRPPPGAGSRSTSSSSTSSTSVPSPRRGRSTPSIPHLAGLRELGVTAIELMPVATFPGDRGWGYDGVYLFAPHPAYGGPEGLARLVDAAHREGLGVIMDVVHNHIGPGSEAVTAFGPYLTDRLRDLLGRRRRLLRRRACASGRSRTRSSGWTTTGSTGCGWTRSTRSATTRRATSSRSSPSACTRARRARSSSPRRAPTTTGRSRSGGTTRGGRTASTTRCMPC